MRKRSISPSLELSSRCYTFPPSTKLERAHRYVLRMQPAFVFAHCEASLSPFKALEGISSNILFLKVCYTKSKLSDLVSLANTSIVWCQGNVFFNFDGWHSFAIDAPWISSQEFIVHLGYIPSNSLFVWSQLSIFN